MLREGLAFCFVLGAILAACSGGEDGPAGSACVQVSSDCKPLYDPPIYSTLFEKTFRPTCASGVGTCHTGDAAKGGLVFENADTAYSMLLGTQGGRARVIANNPSCSLLVEKLESTDPNFRMPPGSTALSPAERCAIELWIANGAKR